METCTMAAIRLPNGAVITGRRHSDCILEAKRSTSTNYISQSMQGFVTTTGRFVDRTEGMQLQMAAGAKSAQHGELRGDHLFSEDLY